MIARMWTYTLWGALNVAIVLGVFELLNTPSTAAVICALFLVLITVTLNIGIAPKLLKQRKSKCESIS